MRTALEDLEKESHVQAKALEVLRLFGYDAWRIGQQNAKGTQDAGPSDIIATHGGDHLLLFVEVKRKRHRKKGNGQSDAQRLFQAAIESTLCAHYLLVDDVVVLAERLSDLRRAARRIS